MNKNKKILLIVTGSIAAYKAVEIIRLLAEASIKVTCVMTKSAQQFITSMSLASISGTEVYDDLFSLKDETQMGHIKLSRDNDLILVAPASADFIGKMANGLADDLASTILLASDKKIAIAPAMNVKMWENKALQRNIKLLKSDKVCIIGPISGSLACGEEGYGRMCEPSDIVKQVVKLLK